MAKSKKPLDQAYLMALRALTGYWKQPETPYVTVLDEKRIMYWLAQFAEVLERPEIHDTVKQMLERQAKEKVVCPAEATRRVSLTCDAFSIQNRGEGRHPYDSPLGDIMERTFFTVGCLSALIGVAAGAFGAHALKSRLDSEMLAVFEVGVRYQMYHAFALIAAAWAYARWPGPLVTTGGWLFVAGTLLFSGSLYVLSLTSLRWLGAITPLGGLAFLAGWLCLAWACWKT